MKRDYVSTLVVSKGHAFSHDAFLEMFEAMDDIEITLVQQPAAQIILQPEHITEFDAVLFYDMSGMSGHGVREDMPGGDGEPPADYMNSIMSLLERGTGILMFNHGLLSWPDWPMWRKISGTSFMLKAGELNGQSLPGSGYRGGHGPLPNATTYLTPALKDHPVLEGLKKGFPITDELYLKSDVFEDDVLPLMRSDFGFVTENFTPPPMAPAEEQDNWSHPMGSNLLVWANACGNSPVVASDIGDGPEAFANSDFRTLIHNALTWVASSEARQWAAAFRASQNER